MPLIHSKTPKAFKKNIETEMKHGKPQKQAVAIAYSEKRKAEHHKAHGGEMCAHGGKLHCNVGCYDDGGQVAQNDGSKETLGTAIGYPGSPKPKPTQQPKMMAKGGESVNQMSGKTGMVRTDTEANQNQKGVNQHGYKGSSGGISQAGAYLRDSKHGLKGGAETAKEIHKDTLSELQSMPKPKLMAEGGSVDSWTKRSDNEKGINKAAGSGGRSEAGAALHPAFSVAEDIDKDVAKRKHHKVLGEMKAMKKPHGNYAHGGEAIEDGEHEMNEELHMAIGSELMDALERKDKKGIMEALKAAVMECMNGEYK